MGTLNDWCNQGKRGLPLAKITDIQLLRTILEIAKKNNDFALQKKVENRIHNVEQDESESRDIIGK